MGKSGKVLIICAPSGTGKSTIINYLREQGIEFHFSISATSRAPRGKERNGVEYFFKTEEEFRQLIAKDAFIEWEEVFAGQLYGTLKSEVEKTLTEGNNLVFDVDIHGGLRIKEYFGDRALSIFILPPSIDALRERLVNRGTETMEKIEKRVARAEYEISRAKEFDRQIVNDDLEKAEAEALQIVNDFLSDEKDK
jgi:guanylate kinase